jgi:hypothetical protein
MIRGLSYPFIPGKRDTCMVRDDLRASVQERQLVVPVGIPSVLTQALHLTRSDLFACLYSAYTTFSYLQ